MNFVLNHVVIIPRDERISIIVKTSFGKNIGYLLTNSASTRSNEADALKESPETVLPKNVFTLFHPFVIQNKSLSNKIAKNFYRP